MSPTARVEESFINLLTNGGREKKRNAPYSDLAVESLAKQLLPRFVKAASVGDTELKEAMQTIADELRKEIDRIDNDVGGLSGAARPRFVRCPQRDGKTHITASITKAFCGYEWAASGAKATPSKSPLVTKVQERCDRCWWLARARA